MYPKYRVVGDSGLRAMRNRRVGRVKFIRFIRV